MDEEQVVFRALADPTRRALLDALFAQDGQTVGQLVSLFPAVTRFAVMKHLTVLEEAGLVATERVGKYAQPFTRALLDVRNAAEGRHRRHEEQS